MKKLILLVSVMFSMVFVSCTANADKTTITNDTVAVDSVTVDSIK